MAPRKSSVTSFQTIDNSILGEYSVSDITKQSSQITSTTASLQV
ncbi:hypothetical protein NIES4101_65420 [Calothrix sp. NIES-4101]|nr:hypothetical protein NIES4101_65420 [Calothrix sp. NIES-4101]